MLNDNHRYAQIRVSIRRSCGARAYLPLDSLHDCNSDVCCATRLKRLFLDHTVSVIRRPRSVPAKPRSCAGRSTSTAERTKQKGTRIPLNIRYTSRVVAQPRFGRCGSEQRSGCHARGIDRLACSAISNVRIIQLQETDASCLDHPNIISSTPFKTTRVV